MSSEFNVAAQLKERPVADLSRLSNRGVMSGAVGIVAVAIGYFMVDLSQFLQSYLVAYMFWIGISLGSLSLLMVQHLSGGAWGLVARRVFEASTRTLPLMLLMFIPIAMNMPTLYKWARPEAIDDARLKGALLVYAWSQLVFLERAPARAFRNTCQVCTTTLCRRVLSSLPLHT